MAPLAERLLRQQPHAALRLRARVACRHRACLAVAADGGWAAVPAANGGASTDAELRQSVPGRPQSPARSRDRGVARLRVHDQRRDAARAEGYETVSLASSDFRVQVEDPEPTRRRIRRAREPHARAVRCAAACACRCRVLAVRCHCAPPSCAWSPTRSTPKRAAWRRACCGWRCAIKSCCAVRVRTVRRASACASAAQQRRRSSSGTRARVTMHVLRAGPATDAGHRPRRLGRPDLDAPAARGGERDLAECDLTFGDPEEAVDRDRAAPAAVSARCGERRRFAGARAAAIRFRVADQRIGPIATRAGATPVETARDIAHELRASGFYAEVSGTRPRARAPDASADVMVRATDGGARSHRGRAARPSCPLTRARACRSARSTRPTASESSTT